MLIGHSSLGELIETSDGGAKHDAFILFYFLKRRVMRSEMSEKREERVAMRNIQSLDVSGGGRGRNWLGECRDTGGGEQLS